MNLPARGHGCVTRPRVLLGALALLIASVGATIAADAAGTAAVTTTADAWVDAGNPTVNHGATTWLQIDNSPDLHAYTMFNVAVPAGEHVSSAQLTIRPNQTNTGGFEVHTSTADWVESAITYANAPAVGSTVYGVSGALTAGVDVTLDVTSAVPAAGGAVSLVLVNRTGTSYSVKSREGGVSTAPRLTVTTAANAVSAPTASFTTSSTSGNAPLTVQFTDTSTGSPSGWSWDFGDGTTSTQQNPSHVFQNVGSYSVTLTASNGGGSTTASTTIAANAPPPPPNPPVASFTTDSVAGTAPLSVTFTDTSTGGATAWSWDFGDSSSSTLQSPSHVFQTAGSFTVTLTASNGGGFSTASTTITVSPPATPDPPTANYTAVPTSGTAPLTVQFTDSSTGTPTAWSWDFGDGTTSTQQNPSHVFQNAGGYTVTLTASNAGGGTAKSTTITANVAAPVAAFTATPSSGAAPLTVQFTDTSTGGPTAWSWNFGDGTAASTLQNPSHVFQTAGSYTVTLTASNTGGSTTKSTTVAANPPAPVAAFTATPTSGTAPLTVQFTDTSTGGATAWSWNFGDGTTASTLQSPSHVFQTAGSYTVTLTASNTGGSTTKSTTITVNVPPPVAAFTATPTSGAAPLTVQFTDTSTGNATAWSWRFGDGTTASTLQNPSHIFQAAGSYTVTLTASNAGGSTTKSTTITSKPPAPVAGFTATPTSGTAPLTVQFTDTSTGTPTAWSWSFGDGTTASTLQNPSHIFQAAGSYTVTLTASNTGGSTTKSTTITVNPPPPMPPLASFTSPTSSGPAPLTEQFTDTTSGTPTSWSWNFGDGGISSLQNPSYVYRTAGTYTATLTASNALGSSTATKTFTISAGSTNIGIRDQLFTGGPDAVTGEKPESKLWFNDGVWWADMFDSASGTFHIFRLNRSTEQWVDTGTQLDTRVSTKADTLWDGSHLYVASHVIAASSANTVTGSPARLYRFSYNSATQTYSLDTGYPVNINNNSSETLVIAEDSLGDIWATWAQSSKIYAARSGPGGTSWGAQFVLPTSGASGVSSDDISAIVTVGSAQVGVMWSNQSSGTLYFGVHSDSDKPNQRWTFKVLLSGAHAADDHISLRQLDRDTSGRLYAVVKTSYNDITPPDPNAPLINVWVRDTSGNWSSNVFGRVADNHTRAILMLDSTNQMIYVFATGPSIYGNGAFVGSIYMKRTPMSAISFAPGLGTPVIRDAKSAAMNNVTSTKQTVTSASGLVVMASNDTTREYWHADLALTP